MLEKKLISSKGKIMKPIILAVFVFILVMSCAWLLTKSISVGLPAPEFRLMGDDNKMYVLSEQTSQRIVLYFYPRDNTPGCTKQACGITEDYASLNRHGIKIFGINYQSPATHRVFKQKYNLPFVLLSDTTKKVARQYGAYSWWHPMFPKRITVLIENGKIKKIIENVDVNRHVEQIVDGFELRDI